MLDLTISIEKNILKTDEFTVKDGTTWGDPARGSKNLVLLIERFAKSEYIPLEASQITPDSTPSIVSEWKIKLKRDAYYKLLVVAADSHNQESTYLIDKVVYGSTDGHTGLFVSVDENVPAGTSLSDPYFWIPVLKIEDFPFAVDNGSDYLCKDHVHDLASRVCVAEKALKFAGNKCDCPDKAVADDYYWSLLYHHSTIYSVAFGEYEEAGRYLDQVVDRCTNGSAEDEEDCGCNG
jgi:hypothetical protein